MRQGDAVGNPVTGERGTAPVRSDDSNGGSVATDPRVAPRQGGGIPRGKAERILRHGRDPEELARLAYREAFPNPVAHVNGQAVLDLENGEVRPSAYVEGHADDPGFEHLLPLVECEAELKERLSEEEFVLLARNGRRPGAEEIARGLDAAYGGPTRVRPPGPRGGRP